MEKIDTRVCKFYACILGKTVTTCNGFDVKERGAGFKNGQERGMLGISWPPIWSFRGHQWEGLGRKERMWVRGRLRFVCTHTAGRGYMVTHGCEALEFDRQCSNCDIRHSWDKAWRMLQMFFTFLPLMFCSVE